MAHLMHQESKPSGLKSIPQILMTHKKTRQGRMPVPWLPIHPRLLFGTGSLLCGACQDPAGMSGTSLWRPWHAFTCSAASAASPDSP